MEYTHPKYRDVFAILAKDVFVDYDSRVVRSDSGKTGVVITPRDAESLKLLKNVLDMHNVRWKQIRPGVDLMSDNSVERIVFALGQDEWTDITVREMHQDAARLRDVNNMLYTAKQFDKEKIAEAGKKVQDKSAALDELKRIIGDVVGDVRSGDGGKYFYLYFPDRHMERAKELLKILDIGAEPHMSHLDDRVVEVMRVPAVMVPGHVLKILGDLSIAATSHGKSKPGNNQMPGNVDGGRGY